MEENTLKDTLKADFDTEKTPEQPAENAAQERDSVHQAAGKPSRGDVLTAEEAQALAPLYSDVVLAIKQVYDPEIPVNVYDLGLIYDLFISRDHEVSITMTFTAPTCPMADEVMAEVRRMVEDVPGVKSCSIELVFEPAWDQSMLSEEARLELGLDLD